MNAFVTVFYDWSRASRVCSPGQRRSPCASPSAWCSWAPAGPSCTTCRAITKNFTALGIPAPEILTPFVSGVEFVGGLLLLLGLLTRFTAVPLMIVMVVAIISAKASDIDSLETFLGFEEVSYFVMFAWLAIAGPGPVSVDHFILQAADRDPVDHGA